MSQLKKYAKYIIWIVAFYIFTNLLIFIGFNATYHKIDLKADLPEQISIDRAEATKSQGRVYGHLKSTDSSELNGKFIKISVYNSNNENIATEYLKIENLESNKETLFKGTFTAKEATSYEISIVDKD